MKKNFKLKKFINLIIIFIFIIALFNFILSSFTYLTTGEELTTAFNSLIGSDSFIGNFTKSTYEAMFGGVSNQISIYCSTVFGLLWYYIFVFGVPTLILWLVLRISLLITTWGGKVDV